MQIFNSKLGLRVVGIFDIAHGKNRQLRNGKRELKFGAL